MTSLPPDPTSPEAADDLPRPDGTPDLVARDATRRVRRRKWRRRRRVLGTLAFLAAVGALGYVVATAAGVGKGGDQAAGPTASSAATTTSSLPPAGPYRVIEGLNVRAGPGSTFQVVGTITIGQMVTVLCVAEGDLVNGPNGQTTKWLKILTPVVPVFVTAAYVSVGADLGNPAKIAPCAP